MHLRTSLRLVSLGAATALATATLSIAAPAAHAAPVFTDANTNLAPEADAYSSGTGCGTTSIPGPNTTVPVVENGPTATATGSVSATYANTGDPTDTATGTATETATASVKSAGGTLKSMDFTSSGSYRIDQALATSACDRYLYADVHFNFDFTLAQPGYLHIKMSNSGAASYGEVYIYQYHATGNEPYLDHYGSGLKFNGTDDVLLPAGEYRGYVEGYVSPDDYVRTDSTGSASTSVHATFAVVGSQTVAQTGKGGKYVTFASARACTTHVLGASVTGKKKQANKIKSVTYYVNGAKVKKLKTPKKGEAVNLPVTDDQTVAVVAKVQLFPKKKGKPAKVVETSASYEACT